MIDTHTHLNFEAFTQDWREVVERAVEAGLKAMIVVGTELASSKRAIELAESHTALYASVGIHPHHAREFLISNYQFLNKSQIPNPKIQDLIKELEELARHPKVVAIGEVGLDYHNYIISKYSIINDPKGRMILKNLQKRLLGMQVEIAKKLDKPLILHSREAGEEVLDTIEHFSKSDGVMPKGVFHCFDGDENYAKKILRAGLYISFTGNVTFVKDRARAAQKVPLDRLLLETDCPYMMPYRKRERCEPKDVMTIAQFHAQQRGLTIEEVERQTTSNAKRLFKL